MTIIMAFAIIFIFIIARFSGAAKLYYNEVSEIISLSLARRFLHLNFEPAFLRANIIRRRKQI